MPLQKDGPPLELSVNATDAAGVVSRFGSEDDDPSTIVQGINFSTQRMSGFTTASFNLSRRIDRDNTDLHLLDDTQIIGADGTVAWEGRVQATPRSFDSGGHSLSVQMTGHIARLADRKMTMIFVDRDLTAFTGEPSTARRAALLAGGFHPQSSTSVIPDTSGTPGVVQQTDRVANAAAAPTGPVQVVEAWYDAGPNNVIGAVYMNLTSYNNGTGLLIAPWVVQRVLSTDDIGTSFYEALGTLGGSYSGYYNATGTDRRFIYMNFYYNAAATSDGQFSATWRTPAVYGNHGLTLVGDTDPKGVLASDVIRWLANRYAPQLNTTGIQATATPIGHLAYKDPITPYDVCLRVNAQHLWNLACWEDKRLTFAPIDLTDWDWEVRHDEMGTTVGLQGDSTDDLANGIVVSFTNVATGRVEVLTPDNYSQLRDLAIDNPANLHGIQRWTDYDLTFPATREDALAIGQAALAEFNQPKSPGSFDVTGHIRDRQGNWQPAWLVRAGDRVRLTSSAALSDRPRAVQETSYSHDSRTVTIAVDSTLRRLDAILDRASTDLTAAGLAA